MLFAPSFLLLTRAQSISFAPSFSAVVTFLSLFLCFVSIPFSLSLSLSQEAMMTIVSDRGSGWIDRRRRILTDGMAFTEI